MARLNLAKLGCSSLEAADCAHPKANVMMWLNYGKHQALITRFRAKKNDHKLQIVKHNVVVWFCFLNR